MKNRKVFYAIYILFSLLLIVLFRFIGRSNESKTVSGVSAGAAGVFFSFVSVRKPDKFAVWRDKEAIRGAFYRLFRIGSARGHPFLSVT